MMKSSSTYACDLFLFLLLVELLTSCQGGDRLLPGQHLTANQTITSANGLFTLGFIVLEQKNNSHERWYLGILYAGLPNKTVAWIANREQPLPDPSSAVLNLTQHGNLLLSQNSSPVWLSPGRSKSASSATLRQDGNLVVLDAANSSNILWQSFDEPGNTLLPGMKLTGSRKLTAWASEHDASPGRFQLQIRERSLVLTENETSDHGCIISNGSLGHLNLSYWPEAQSFVYCENFQDYFKDPRSRLMLSPTGKLLMYQLQTELQLDSEWQLDGENSSSVTSQWELQWEWPEVCGANAVNGVVLGGEWPSPYTKCQSFEYKKNAGPCACPLGFNLYKLAWEKTSKYRCNRNIQLTCTDDPTVPDIFRKICTEFPNDGVLQAGVLDSECKNECLQNCSCTAYAIADNGSCHHWFGNLFNLRIAGNSSSSIFIRLVAGGDVETAGGDVETDHSTVNRQTSRKRLQIGRAVAISAAAVVFVGLVLVASISWVARGRSRTNHNFEAVEGLRVFTYRELRAATKNFSERLGKGGSGSVYMGELCDGTPVAVKHLEGTTYSSSDKKQFQAEVTTISVARHINVVRLLGLCNDAKHRMLVYEFMPNGSLASQLFRKRKQQQQDTAVALLDWNSRFRIALGTARGLAYLHESCRDCVIHCDIKPDNILLDAMFTPKIADFGLAKLLTGNHSGVLTTMRGTLGYMAPEWFSGRPVTVKTDVYSFGMVLLEIVSGRRSMRVADSLVEQVRIAGEISRGNGMAALDERLRSAADENEVVRVAVAGLWCIQDKPSSRPSMGDVVKLLEDVIAGPCPGPPVPASLLSLVEDDTQDQKTLEVEPVPAHNSLDGVG